jgi:uncharacterized membrane protein
MKVNKGTAIAATAAILILSGAIQAKAEDKAAGDKVKCSGVNECKGKGSCAGAGGSCAGQNSCKGKGVISTSKAECEKQGGKVVE